MFQLKKEKAFFMISDIWGIYPASQKGEENRPRDFIKEEMSVIRGVNNILRENMNKNGKLYIEN